MPGVYVTDAACSVAFALPVHLLSRPYVTLKSIANPVKHAAHLAFDCLVRLASALIVIDCTPLVCTHMAISKNTLHIRSDGVSQGVASHERASDRLPAYRAE